MWLKTESCVQPGKILLYNIFLHDRYTKFCIHSDRVISPSTAPIKALGKFYHPGHIKCYHCLCPIDGSTGWKEYHGRVYCRSDFKALFLPKCKSCHGTIEKNAVSAMDGKLNGKWHLECFGCHVSIVCENENNEKYTDTFYRRVIVHSQITHSMFLMIYHIVEDIITN